MFSKYGWTTPIDWKEIKEHNLQEMGLYSGHIVRFMRCVKDMIN